MKTDAPGKLVISGAYAVLRGAPAIVSAVDRRVVVDTERPASYRAPEVEAGLQILGGEKQPPFYDASALRSAEGKLGLGSSAAICVASLGAILAQDYPLLDEPSLREMLYPIAREAHRRAQGGGSGIDVAAACFGGTITARLDLQSREAPPQIEPVRLPDDLFFEVWGARESASTSEFVRRVFDLEETKPKAFDSALGCLHEASVAALEALRSGRALSFIAALKAQVSALKQLGTLAALPIVTEQIAWIAHDLGEDCVFLPSGAGGGDISLYVGPRPSSDKFRERAIEGDLFLVPLALGSEGFRLLGSSVHD